MPSPDVPALDVIALGELLIDFVPTRGGVTLAQADTFVKAPGGAPANVAVGLARLGLKSGFMGKVGDEAFGHWLAEVLEGEGVDLGGLRFDPEARTALAFVSLTASGERDFMFYRQPSADMRHHPDEIDPGYLAAAKVLHVGSISLSAEPARGATLKAIDLARAQGLEVSYDPNLRMALWPDEEAAREGILSIWERASVIKISDAELGFLSGETSLAAARSLLHGGLALLVVTRGEDGVSYLTPRSEGEVASVRVEAVDTTGAGDAFMAGLLAGLLEDKDALQNTERLEAVLRRANACGALATTKRGAIPALPRREELERFLASRA